MYYPKPYSLNPEQHELESQLLKGGYMGDSIGGKFMGYIFKRILGV